MRGLKVLSLVVVVVLVAAALWSAFPLLLGGGGGKVGGKVVWVSVEEGWAASEKLNRPLMLYFHSEACPACHKLEREVFDNEEIASFLNGNFVCAYVDVKKPEGLTLTKKYRVIALPTVIFFSPGGSLLGKFYGYMPPEEFSSLAGRVLEEFKTGS